MPKIRSRPPYRPPRRIPMMLRDPGLSREQIIRLRTQRHNALRYPTRVAAYGEPTSVYDVRFRDLGGFNPMRGQGRRRHEPRKPTGKRLSERAREARGGRRASRGRHHG